MAVPKYYEFYNAFLESLSTQKTITYEECKEFIKQKMNLTDDQLSVRSGSGSYLWENRVGWCATYLKNAGLISSPKRAIYQITDEGKILLEEKIEITDELLVARYPAFALFKNRKNKGNKHNYILEKPDETVIEAERLADEELIDLIQEDFDKIQPDRQIITFGPREKATPIILHGRRTFPRNRTIAINALSLAKFLCEVNPEHPTFIRRTTKLQYTEPHHLIPMAYQDQFDMSLDVEENIVSLCCTCHKEIHYGEYSNLIVEKLFKKRKESLKSAGIDVDLEQLLNLYKLL